MTRNTERAGSELDIEVLKLRLVVVMAIRLLERTGMSKRNAVDVVRSKLSRHGLVQHPPKDKAAEKVSAATLQYWERRAHVYWTQLTIQTGVPAEYQLTKLAFQAAELSAAPFPASEGELNIFLADGFLDQAVPAILNHLAGRN